ncbi:MAG: hypothetical protein V2I33_24985, partial [Kangiellaceae bacterium]|nr:hypothetical protein [Kangiellaceae bacterium]
PKVSALLALTKQDLVNSSEISKDLDENNLIPPQYIIALMSVYEFSTANDYPHPKSDPYAKKDHILSNIKHLANLFDVVDR